jgi:preprotein translocase subunit SecF
MRARLPHGPQAALIDFAIRFRGIVIVLGCILLGYGFYALLRANYDVFPEFAPPQVGIQTEAPGLTPEQVEVLITRPIENAINGVPGVQKLRSISIQGLSVVTVFFDPAGDIYRDRQVVAERLAVAAQQLPEGTQLPAMTPLTSSTSTVLVIGLSSESRSLMELRTIADWTVRPRLLAVPGVAKVVVFGGDTRSIQVQVHPDRLIQYHLSLSDVLTAARRATGVRGAGFIETRNQRVVFQSEGQSLTADDIARTVLLSQGAASVTLANVADIVEAPEPPIGGAAIQGKPGVVINVSAQFGANTVAVTQAVEAALEELRGSLATDGIMLHAQLFRPANFIAVATANVGQSLLLGAALVIVVLFLFLFDLPSAAISCCAIPLSLLAAIIVLERLGVTLNTMTLGGLAIAIGVVVDDAVIDVENIMRRVRENGRLRQPRPMARIVLEACLEVRGAVVYATFAVILVVLPVVTLPGIAGRLFAPLAFAYSLAVLASLVVALTAVPALAMVPSGTLKLELQEGMAPLSMIGAKVLVLGTGWLLAGVPILLAGMLWISYGGSLYVPEVTSLTIGHVLNAGLVIALAAAALAEHPSTAAILVLAFTVGTWVLGFVAAFQGGIWEQIVSYTPSEMLQTFRRGLVRLDLMLAMLALIVAALVIAASWIRLGVPMWRRALESVVISRDGRKARAIAEQMAECAARIGERRLIGTRAVEPGAMHAGNAAVRIGDGSEQSGPGLAGRIGVGPVPKRGMNYKPWVSKLGSFGSAGGLGAPPRGE